MSLKSIAVAVAGTLTLGALILLMLDVALRKVHIDLDQVRAVVYPVLVQLPIVGARLKEGGRASQPM
ncbi:MAG: hypothetical protein KC464_31475, partial [Myxococcales bacterium]|nr:hypothetical protein [Myxococcales bacterium]